MFLVLDVLCVYVVFKVSSRLHRWLEGPTGSDDEKIPALFGLAALGCGVGALMWSGVEFSFTGLNSWQWFLVYAPASLLALSLLWGLRIAYSLARKHVAKDRAGQH